MGYLKAEVTSTDSMWHAVRLIDDDRQHIKFPIRQFANLDNAEDFVRRLNTFLGADKIEEAKGKDRNRDMEAVE